MRIKGKIIETPRQRNAFLIYFNLREKRSLENVRKTLGGKGLKISDVSISKWSSKFNWVDRVKKLDDEVEKKAEALAIKQHTVNKSEILKNVKDTFQKYSEALLAGKTIPASKDFKNMWEIMRTELGMDLPSNTPTVKIEINKKVLNIINEAENKAKEIVEAEIIDE